MHCPASRMSTFLFCLLLLKYLVGPSSDRHKKRMYPQLAFVPTTSFSCLEKSPGYYADHSPLAKCQVYHVCDHQGRKYTYLCPNQTLFNQALLTCDHWFHETEKPHGENSELLIGYKHMIE
ncbi:uncharacterized protein LOC111087190 isoform X2 [Limulus polyphemus]|uniref:Uncharacterized protein LOC111087190 isoform X2 n=1 Tax=Limulus polyphemus TaxID=6850 RepID=A0ABM1SYJ8_LIMPO|nr:uncharacterized protein LOC111087190 isoform X2 [Limulus polyphemus]